MLGFDAGSAVGPRLSTLIGFDKKPLRAPEKACSAIVGSRSPAVLSDLSLCRNQRAATRFAGATSWQSTR